MQSSIFSLVRSFCLLGSALLLVAPSASAQQVSPPPQGLNATGAPLVQGVPLADDDVLRGSFLWQSSDFVEVGPVNNRIMIREWNLRFGADIATDSNGNTLSPFDNAGYIVSRDRLRFRGEFASELDNTDEIARKVTNFAEFLDRASLPPSDENAFPTEFFAAGGQAVINVVEAGGIELIEFDFEVTRDGDRDIVRFHFVEDSPTCLFITEGRRGVRVGPNRELVFVPQNGALSLNDFAGYLTLQSCLDATPTVPVNNPPVAVDDDTGFSTPEGMPLDIDGINLTINDIDEDVGNLTIASVINLANGNGTVSLLANNDIRFTPIDENFFGEAFFEYTVTDGANVSAPARVTIDITPVNDAPIVSSQTINDQNVVKPGEGPGEPVSARLAITDDGFDALSVEITPPLPAEVGTVTIESVLQGGPGTPTVGFDVIFEAGPEFFREVVFDYVVNDNDDAELQRTASVTIVDNDIDNDGEVNGSDTDIDGDNVNNNIELSHGTDPYSISSLPMDPLGCAEAMTDDELRDMGYEPVRAYLPNSRLTSLGTILPIDDESIDDRSFIQAAINAANRERRAVYFHPGEYLVHGTLEVRQEAFFNKQLIVMGPNGGNQRFTPSLANEGRFGNTLVGSYCGDKRPIIRMADGVAPIAPTIPSTPSNDLAVTPTPVIAVWRRGEDPTDIRDSDSSRDWNQVIRNLHIVVGANAGAVGIRHLGAEGSAAQELTIDATGAFAGLYQVNSSGGYTYDVEIIGGEYGVFMPSARGGSPLLVGLTLREQNKAPIAMRHFAPVTIVGFDIKASSGQIVHTIIAQGNGSNFMAISDIVPDLRRPADPGGNHISFVDGSIEITDPDNVEPIISVDDRSVYLSNVWVRGEETIVAGDGSPGVLDTANPGSWTRVREYSNQGANQIEDTVEGLTNLSPNLVSRHMYPAALCNVEGRGVKHVYYNAPNTAGDDTQAINMAIAQATPVANLAIANPAPEDYVKRVFLPAGQVKQGFYVDPNTGFFEVFEDPRFTMVPDVSTNREDDFFLLENGEIFLNDGPNDIRDLSTHIGEYEINDTITLEENTRLCGATKYSSILSASDWVIPEAPNVQQTMMSSMPIIQSPSASDATTVLADVKTTLPSPSRNPNANLDNRTVSVNGSNYVLTHAYTPSVFAVNWQTGQNSVVRDLFMSKSGDSGHRRQVQIHGSNAGGRWYGMTLEGPSRPRGGRSENSFFTGENNTTFERLVDQLVLSPLARNLEIKDNGQALRFYPFHAQHMTQPLGAQVELINAQNVRMYGIKSESAATPQTMEDIINANSNLMFTINRNLIPSWMRIKNSSNISLIGHDTIGSQINGRGYIEITNSSDITISNMSRRDSVPTASPLSAWFLVRDITDPSRNIIAEDFVSVFRIPPVN